MLTEVVVVRSFCNVFRRYGQKRLDGLIWIYKDDDKFVQERLGSSKSAQPELIMFMSMRSPLIHNRLARERLRAGNGVAVEVVVDVGGVTRVRRLDVSGNLDGRRTSSAAATSDLELGAGQVELRYTAGVVDGELLNAHEILARGDTGRDVDGVRL
jgi:hypothetical protein